MPEVIVIGGGVIGLSVAYELAGQGVAVEVLDQGPIGREASWAGAGMLPPGNLERRQSAEQQLRALSHSLWPNLSEELSSSTGIDNGYRKCGSLELRLSGPDDQLDTEIENWRSEGVAVTSSGRSDLQHLEPEISPNVIAGYRLPDLAQVRNPRHLKALEAGCAMRGVRFLPGTPVAGFAGEGESIHALRTPGGRLEADAFCLCAGAWSAGLAETCGFSIPIRPVRGQIVLLKANPLPIRHVLQSGSRYLVPRPDGRILVGSTEEEAGFEKKNTAEAVGELLRFAAEMVPSLANAELERCWAGLRPGSQDGLPYLGRLPNYENLFIAAGHFRSGLQMSPGTGRLLRQLILRQEISISLEGLDCLRAETSQFPSTVS